MNVTGTANLAGTLEISLINGFVPTIGQSFVIMTATSINGIFDCLEATPLPNGVFRVTYAPTTVTLSVQTVPPPPADLNGDGIIVRCRPGHLAQQLVPAGRPRRAASARPAAPATSTRTAS